MPPFSRKKTTPKATAPASIWSGFKPTAPTFSPEEARAHADGSLASLASNGTTPTVEAYQPGSGILPSEALLAKWNGPSTGLSRDPMTAAEREAAGI